MNLARRYWAAESPAIGESLQASGRSWSWALAIAVIGHDAHCRNELREVEEKGETREE